MQRRVFGDGRMQSNGCPPRMFRTSWWNWASGRAAPRVGVKDDSRKRGDRRQRLPRAQASCTVLKGEEGGVFATFRGGG